MIKVGRPPKGYSDYENIFYLLKNELNTVFNILENNVSELETRYLKDKAEYKEKLSRYYEKSKELRKKYIEQGEKPEIADSIASGEAQIELGKEFDIFYDELENLPIIKNQVIDSTIKAALIALYTLLEFNLSKVADIFSPRVNSKNKKTEYYHTSKTNLEKKFEIIYEQECDKEFEYSKLIRNKITHENSSSLIPEVKDVIKFYPDFFEIEEDMFVFRKIDFIKRFKTVAVLLLESIEKGIGKKIKNN